MGDEQTTHEVVNTTQRADESGRNNSNIEIRLNVAGRFGIDKDSVGIGIDDFLSSLPLPDEAATDAANDIVINLFGTPDVETIFYERDENGEFVRLITLGEISRKLSPNTPDDEEGATESGGYISMYLPISLMKSLFGNVGIALGADKNIYLNYGQSIANLLEEKTPRTAEEVTLAQFATRDAFLNHSLAMKTLEGMVSIAYGETTSYELTPKRGSKSGEVYRLTASEDACARFFAEDGGNVQIMEKILETVHTLIKDERAEGFVYSGCVWFTTGKILEEVLRTQGGTIKQARHNVNRKMIDDALLAASGAQIVGSNPEGKTLGVTYFLKAIKRESVTFKGNVYRDVWGFDLKGWTVNDYAQELTQAYKYPLLDMPKPLTMNQAAITRFLEDKLHEARGILYTHAGNKQKRTKYTQTLSWERIFDTFHPIGAMDYRQKKKLVEDFQLILSNLADMDSKNKLHEGRPLYINAHSERQAGKGSGSGAWINLVIEYSSNFHKPKISLL